MRVHDVAISSIIFNTMASFASPNTLTIGILTAGGLAPCLSAATGYLISKYGARYPDIKIICYKNGYKGLLLGDSVTVPKESYSNAKVLLKHGGSPIGNSRVKLTNVKDCIKRELCELSVSQPTPRIVRWATRWFLPGVLVTCKLVMRARRDCWFPREFESSDRPGFE
jgi:hypothetical protein